MADENVLVIECGSFTIKVAPILELPPLTAAALLKAPLPENPYGGAFVCTHTPKVLAIFVDAPALYDGPTASPYCRVCAVAFFDDIPEPYHSEIAEAIASLINHEEV